MCLELRVLKWRWNGRLAVSSAFPLHSPSVAVVCWILFFASIYFLCALPNTQKRSLLHTWTRMNYSLLFRLFVPQKYFTSERSNLVYDKSIDFVMFDLKISYIDDNIDNPVSCENYKIVQHSHRLWYLNIQPNLDHVQQLLYAVAFPTINKVCPLHAFHWG